MIEIDELSVPKNVKEQRMRICDTCPLILREDGQSISKNGFSCMSDARCGDCGCFVNVKGSFKDWTCPQGKW